MGDRHLLNPKFFVAAHCVIVAKPPAKSAAQSIPVESGEHVQELKVKWSRTGKHYTELRVRHSQLLSGMACQCVVADWYRLRVGAVCWCSHTAPLEASD